jgi:glycerophosphoryl diester phosphodiesterase
LVERILKQGREVHVWTVDEPDDIALCIGLGVDAIITNKPAEVVAAIGD